MCTGYRYRMQFNWMPELQRKIVLVILNLGDLFLQIN